MSAGPKKTSPVDFAGEPLTIAFNPTYLTDGLGSLHSERVSFGFTTPEPARGAAARPALTMPTRPDNGPFPGGADRLRVPVDAGSVCLVSD